MGEVNKEEKRGNRAICEESMRHWVTSGRLLSPWQDGNNNNAKRMLRRRLSFNGDRMANSHRQVVNAYEDESDYVNVTKSELKTADTSAWDDETNNSDSDVKSKFDEAFSEGSTTSSAYKDGDNNTEVELRVRVRRFDEENAWLRDELARAEELANEYRRQLHLFQQKLDQMREKCDQLLKENDEHKERINMVEAQERRCQVALQRIDKERNALLEKLKIDNETFNRSLEELNRDKLYWNKRLSMCEAKLEEKEIQCATLQKNLDDMNDLIASLEDEYEKKIRYMQDKSDDLTSENVELKMRLLTLDCPTSLDQEACLTSTRYLDSSDENLKYQNDQKVQLEESLYAELKASGFSCYDMKCESKIRELELEADWCNSELVEAGRQIEKIINFIRKTKRYSSPSRTPKSPNTSDLEISPILLIFERIKQLSHEVSEALKKPSTTDSSSQVSADPRIASEYLKEFYIQTFQDYLDSPIKVPVPVETNTPNVFLTCRASEIKDKIELVDAKQLGLDIKNNVTNIEDLGSSNAVGSMSAVASASHDDISSFFVKIQSETKINSCTGEVCRLSPVGQENLSVSELASVDCSIGDRQSQEVEREDCRGIDKSDMSVSEKIPRRKISVFQRSFDIDTVFEVQDGGAVSESHKLSERCGRTSETDNCPPNVLIDNIDDDRSRIEGVTGYRTTADVSQSSDSSGGSPGKLGTWREEDSSVDSVETKIEGNFLAPARLNLSRVRGVGDAAGAGGTDGARSDCGTGGERNASIEITGDGKTSVTRAMSSGEDSSDDSESDSTEIGGKFQGSWGNDRFSRGSDDRSGFKAPRDGRDERAPRIRRSMSEGENIDLGGGDSCRGCSNGQGEDKRQGSFKKEVDAVAFPSLTDARLQESGIAQLSESEDLEGKDLTEEDLERKFVAFSLGLCTDRVTLPRRRALALRQRDYTEHDLAVEIAKMQQSIQEFAPLCFDSETVERIELACHQVEIIAQCAHRVSCTAETLGAIQQEYRISRAIHLADRFLKILRSRCEKLTAEVAEKKRVLAENNIVIDEGNGEGEGLSSAVRYRALSPTTNRTMMARRRASIATIFRPIGIAQEVTKDNIRQRNSVSGRVTIRRPSFSSEPQRFETEKLTRTDSSSVGELREIFEQAESRRTSREENNNLVRSQMTVCENETVERRMSSSREEPIIETLQEEQEHELHEEEISRFSRTRLALTAAANDLLSWRLLLWCAIITFFIGFYVKDALSITSPCSTTPLRWWSFEEVLSRHTHVRNTAPPPI
ncbi:uncharacterized protein LOC107038357 [Diachasma alloeum]|uniref:uncharacterized protein LOC107038357 n=1 Tax=Diachasma alloeum TaxID=454923 RepID=UPI0007383957|nr:uncharacterized protein LOC107038357 [Diachasma alloeum]